MPYMKPHDVLEMAAEYGALLRGRGLTPAPFPDPECAVDPCGEQSRTDFLRHLLWICEQIPSLINDVGGVQFCMRWIGCVQGGLAACGVVTIAQTRARLPFSLQGRVP